MVIGLLTFEIHLPQSRSLKDRRQVLRSLKDRLRARHNVAVTELEEHADRWQRAGVAVVSAASKREPLERLFETILEEAGGQVPGAILEAGTDFIDAADGGPGGWEADWK